MDNEQLNTLKEKIASATSLEDVRSALDKHRGEIWSEDLEAVKGDLAAATSVGDLRQVVAKHHKTVFGSEPPRAPQIISSKDTPPARTIRRGDQEALNSNIEAIAKGEITVVD